MKKLLLSFFVFLMMSLVSWAQENMLNTPMTLEAIEAGEICFTNNSGLVNNKVNGGKVMSIPINSEEITEYSEPLKKQIYSWPSNGIKNNIITLAEGVTLQITGNLDKKIESGNDIIIDGITYTSMKVSNGAQNTLILPEPAKSITFYSYINRNAEGVERDSYWKEIAGVDYNVEESGGKMSTYKDGDLDTPDVRTYYFETPTSTITFTNNGYQLCYVMEVEYNEYAFPPLTIEAIEDGTVSFINNAQDPILYQINDGAKQSVSSSTIGSIAINAGDRVRFYGDNQTYEDCKITSTSDCYIYGNVMSLVSSNNYVNTTTLSQSAFKSLFADNTHILNHPYKAIELPATTLAEDCYYRMFAGCTNLSKAPELPSLTLSNGCYSGMFSGCTNLTIAPELPATILMQNCYENMFEGCTNLNCITCLASNISAMNCTTDWLKGVSSTGIFKKAVEMSDWTLGVSGIPSGWIVDNYGLSDIDETLYPPLTLEAIEAGEIAFNNKAAGDVYFRVNESLIKRIESGSIGTIAVNSGDRVTFYGDNHNYYGSKINYTGSIECNSDCYVYGNIMSLISSTDYLNQYTVEKNAFLRLFKENTHLFNHPTKSLELPATSLAEGCYCQMFIGCTGLTNAPALPATTLARSCYREMFSGCTSLTEAPELPATTLADYCYDGMFYDCTSLTEAPELPATTLADYCYWGMFEGCTSLTEAPELPATALQPCCYHSMFSNCTNLTDAPELPANNISWSCYEKMFSGCTNLTKAPDLPATELSDYCYRNMFSGCTSLTEAPKLPATELTVLCYLEMFSNCISMSKAPELPATSLANACYENMFAGCSSLTEAPELPATELKYGCYGGMFSNCSDLIEAPELPSTTLAGECYNSMFKGCTALTEAPALPAMTLASGCYIEMFLGCTGLLKAPQLPASALTWSCYFGMFANCTSLIEAPELSASQLNDKCYAGMFSGCTNLAVAPDLPAITLNDECYALMFDSCIALNAAPLLPAKTLANSCYYKMFTNCKNLNSVTCLATDISAENSTKDWLNNVSPTGVFTKAKCMDDWSAGENGIPSGWTVKDATISKTISVAGYATYCSPYALDFSSVDGLTAYKAKVTEEMVTFESVTSVPAMTGVLLKGTAKTYDIPIVGSSNTDVSDNVFIGVIEEEEKEAGIYVLMNGESGVGFYKTKNNFTVGSNTAYLPATSGIRSFIGFVIDDDVTGIESLKSPMSQGETIVYNLKGQRVNKPVKGLYIKNSKKVIR